MSLLTVIGLTACIIDDNEEAEGEKITEYKEYTLTVASRKLPGLAYVGCGNDMPADVYAVKTGDSQEWEQLYFISGFDYESGYEYKIRISKTCYLDNRRGEPAWTEYKLLKIISKEKKDSEGLPSSFVSGVQYKYSPITVSCKVDAALQEIIEADLKANPHTLYGCAYVFDKDLSQWTLFSKDGEELGYGSLEKTQVPEIPKVFRSFLPEEQIHSMMLWNFTYLGNEDRLKRPFYVVIAKWSGPMSKASSPVYRAWLYEDWTEYYQKKYPEAGVNAVVVRHTFD